MQTLNTNVWVNISSSTEGPVHAKINIPVPR